jgi:phosphatidate cytidylyltransferase
MLKQRLLTAVVLLALLLPTLLVASPLPFMVFVALAIGAAAWEWGRLNGLGHALAALYAVALLGAGSAVAYAGASVQGFSAAVAVLWVIGGALALRGAPAAWLRLPQAVRLGIGPLALIPAGSALLLWKSQGLNALLSTLCLVWAADVAAYFAGRRFGRRKLAPAISPGKSWEGVWGGMVGVMLLAVVWVTWLDPWLAPAHGHSLYGQLVSGFGWPLTVLMLVVLAALSVVGDLFESLMKRAVGAKDSSRLLPGHGGVLDRVDALLPVLPAALALVGLAGVWS